MDWNITALTNQTITIQLSFSDPKWVSTFRNDKDEIKMSILKPELFKGAVSKRNLEKDTLRVDAQDYNNQGPLIKIIAEVLDGILAAVMGGNFVLTLIFQTSMQQLWGLVNTLQIIVLTVLFNLKTPLNVQIVLITILKISNFDILPTDDFFSYILSFTDTQPLNQIFEDAGFESSNFILLTGTLLIFLLAYGLLKIILKLPIFKWIGKLKYAKYLPK